MLDMRKCLNCSCKNPITLSLYKGNTILACQPGSQEEQNSQLHLTGGWTETSPAANTHTHTVTHKQTNKHVKPHMDAVRQPGRLTFT